MLETGSEEADRRLLNTTIVSVLSVRDYSHSRAFDRIIMLPPILLDPIPALDTPVKEGEFLLWPDVSGNQVFYALDAPYLLDFSLTVHQEINGNAIKITGGFIACTVSVYAKLDVKTLENKRQTWSDALIRAGYEKHEWRYLPLNLRDLQANVTIPTEYINHEPQIITSNDRGTITFMIGLTAVGVQVWKEALEKVQGNMIPGICVIKANYLAQLSGQVLVKEQTLNTTIGNLLSRLGSEVIHVVNPEISAEAKVIVAGHQTIESVVVELNPSQGQPVSQVFGPEGGQLATLLTSSNLNEIEINWSAKVNYRPSGWPVVRDSGKLSFATKNTTVIVKPDTWLSSYTIMALLIDNQGNVIPNSESVDLANRVQCNLDFTASYLEGGNTLNTAFETSSQSMVKVSFPNPPGQEYGNLKLTFFAQRGGKDNMTTRNLLPDETLVVAKIYPNARIEVMTNRDPATEFSLESEILGLLAKLN